jgi:putative redox protein
MPRAVAKVGEGFRVTARAGSHSIVLDESVEAGGTAQGMTPQETFAAALAACAAMTMTMYARRKGWPLEGAEVATTVERGAAPGDANRVVQVISHAGALDDEPRERLREIAGKCPVHKFVAGPTTLEERLEERPA